jgi:hypothetical protein
VKHFSKLSKRHVSGLAISLEKRDAGITRTMPRR